MIVIKIELWPKGFESRARELGKMYIANTGELGNGKRGNYHVRLFRKGTNTVQREGSVENFPRHSYSVWRLVSRAIKSVFPEEK